MVLPKKMIESSYDLVCKTGGVWFFKGRELLHASVKLREIYLDAFSRVSELKPGNIEPGSKEEEIEKDLLVFNQSTMLMGMAIEVFLKGIIIKKEQVKLGDKHKKLPNHLKGNHDLNSIAVKAGISFSSEEKEILVKFTESIRFSGRYPIPIRLEDFNKFYNENSEPAFLIKNNDKQKFPEVVERVLIKILEAINSLQ